MYLYSFWPQYAELSLTVKHLFAVRSMAYKCLLD